MSDARILKRKLETALAEVERLKAALAEGAKEQAAIQEQLVAVQGFNAQQALNIQESERVRGLLREALERLVTLVEDMWYGDHTPGNFTTQPADQALAADDAARKEE